MNEAREYFAEALGTTLTEAKSPQRWNVELHAARELGKLINKAWHLSKGHAVTDGNTDWKAFKRTLASLEKEADRLFKDTLHGLKKAEAAYKASDESVNESAEVAKTIQQQLKRSMGVIDYLAMGIKRGSFVRFNADSKIMGAAETTGPGLQFDVRGHWKGRVIVRLDPSDTYTLIFGRIRKYNWKVDKVLVGVYASDLGRTIKHNVLSNGIRK